MTANIPAKAKGLACGLSVADFASTWLDAWRSGDSNHIASFLHEEVEFHSSALPSEHGSNVLRGRANVLRQLEQTSEVVPAPDFEILNVISSDRTYIIDYRDPSGGTSSEILKISDGYIVHRAFEIDDFKVFSRSPRQASRAARIIPELLFTLGFLVIFFIAWQYTGANAAANQGQISAVHSFTQSLQSESETSGVASRSAASPPQAAAPAQGTVFGVVYIPRLGADYARPLVEGTDPAQLDTLGLGHYRGTAMPGGLGNFAIAGHRDTHGAVLDNIDQLVPGDKIYVQTKDGYFTYTYRSSEIVTPDRADVLLPVPHRPSEKATERLLTMTTCNPRFGDWERYIGYAVMGDWEPLSAGPPQEIATAVSNATKAA